MCTCVFPPYILIGKIGFPSHVYHDVELNMSRADFDSHHIAKSNGCSVRQKVYTYLVTSFVTCSITVDLLMKDSVLGINKWSGNPCTCINHADLNKLTMYVCVCAILFIVHLIGVSDDNNWLTQFLTSATFVYISCVANTVFAYRCFSIFNPLFAKVQIVLCYFQQKVE